MEVERGDVARAAVFVGGEGVDCIAVAVRKGFGRLKGSVGKCGGIVDDWVSEVCRSLSLSRH